MRVPPLFHANARALPPASLRVIKVPDNFKENL
jgi:hypothetical protein